MAVGGWRLPRGSFTRGMMVNLWRRQGLIRCGGILTLYGPVYRKSMGVLAWQSSDSAASRHKETWFTRQKNVYFISAAELSRRHHSVSAQLSIVPYLTWYIDSITGVYNLDWLIRCTTLHHEIGIVIFLIFHLFTIILILISLK